MWTWIFLLFALTFSGFVTITLAISSAKGIHRNTTLVALCIGTLGSIIEIIYFIILRKRLTYFYECLLFYEELSIEAEVERAATDLENPIDIIKLKFVDENLMNAKRNDSSIYQLYKGKANLKINKSEDKFNTISLSYSLFKGKSVNNKITSFGNEFTPCTDHIDNILNEHMELYSNKYPQSALVDCIICTECQIDCFFLPCGHAGSCFSCGVSLLKTTSICHLCRAVRM